MTVYVYYRRRIYPASVHHNGKVAERLSLAGADKSYRMPRLHLLSDLHHVALVVRIHGLESVAMAHHDDVSHSVVMPREPYHTVEHCFHRIAFLRLYPQHIVVLQRGFAYRQRKRIVIVLHGREIHAESIRTAEQSGRLYANLLLLRRSELMLHRSGCRQCNNK